MSASVICESGTLAIFHSVVGEPFNHVTGVRKILATLTAP